MAADREQRLDQGLATAARLSLGERGAPPDSEQVEQLDLSDLLGLPSANGNKVEVIPLRRPGTRAGIPNNRTREWADYFRSRGYRFPIENLMAVANLPVDDLAKRLRCSPLEAMNIIIKVNAEVAPYLHARLASVELKAKGTPGGEASTLEIEGSLVDITPPTDPNPARAEDGCDDG